MQCPQCSEEVDSRSVYCDKCGARIDGGDRPATPGAPGLEEPVSEGRERFVKAVSAPQNAPAPEEHLWEGSYSKMAMIGSWASAAAATLGLPTVLFLVGVLTTAAAWGWLLLALLLMWLALVLLYFYRRFSVHYVLTTQRFIHESGLLWRTIDRVELVDIDDVTFTQDPVQRAFGVGRIKIDSSDTSTPELKLPGIDRVRYVADLIDDARRKERRRRGLHIEAV